MTHQEANEIGNLIEQLDTSMGMLIVASSTSAIVRNAMEIVSRVSFRLGQLAEVPTGGRVSEEILNERDGRCGM